jgi:high affinity Mn2+ porin
VRIGRGASLVLLLSATVHAQDFLSGEISSDRSLAPIERKDSDSKESASDNQSQIPEHQNWLFHIQGTEIAQGQPGFHSPYAGTNSLRSEDTFKQSSSVDIYLGAHLWPGGEIYFNPEYYQGFGLGNTHGIAAFPNAENYKIGQKIGDIFNAHLFLRQTVSDAFSPVEWKNFELSHRYTEYKW